MGDTTTGACCLIGRDPHKLTPGDISNRLRQTRIQHHVGNMERFKCQHAMCIDQFPGFLVAKIVASVGDALMNMRDHFSTLCPRWCALGSLGQTALRLRQGLFISPKEMGVSDMFPGTQGSKAAQADIDPSS